MVGRHADVFRCLNDCIRVVTGMTMFTQSHKDKDCGHDYLQSTHRCMIVMSRPSRTGHFLLYDGMDGLPKEMFFTIRPGLVFLLKSFDKNEICGC